MILLFVVNTPEFFLSHRLQLAIAARDIGFHVHVATGLGPACGQIARLGFVHHPIPLSRSGKNPLLELYSLFRLYCLMTQIKPNLVHLVTIKPVLYGGLMARMSGVPAVVAAISGLGTVFVDRGGDPSWVRVPVKWLYRLALGHSNIKVVFQNPDDRAMVVSFGAVAEKQTVLIKGSGVWLPDYPVRHEPKGLPVVTFASRLLKDKGVREFVEAARILRARGISVDFWLVGMPDPSNLTSITEDEMKQWTQGGWMKVFGHRNDIAELFSKSNIVVLPSYREGLPKVLIEAAACGRPVVTTDVPGCRDAIEPGLTGLLVPARDAAALADAVQTLLDDTTLRQRMGAAGRVLAEREFAIEKVVNRHLTIYREMVA